jgi:CRP/FNR family transcriptional regulator, anaerobic regulatory protein
MEAKLSELIPFFSEADSKIEDEFRQHAIEQKFPRGTFLSMEGDSCKYFPIIKAGIIRVYKISTTGQEMTLYRIEPGESCVLTISCLLSNNRFPAIAYVESNCEVILIPAKVITDWVSKFSMWNEYIFDYLSRVLYNVITLLENITFKRVDIRIAEYLVKCFLSKGNLIKVTHQEIASDLGTAREVVSRILKDFEKQKLLSLKRGEIIIDDYLSLQKKLTYIQ